MAVAFQKQVVLIVDDSKDLTLLWRLLFEKEGCQVYSAGSLEEARRMLDEHQEITLVLMDLYLGDGFGLELYDEVREDQGRSLPFVFVSGTEERSVIDHIDQLPGACFVSKPIRFSELLPVIMKAREEAQSSSKASRSSDVS